MILEDNFQNGVLQMVISWMIVERLGGRGRGQKDEPDCLDALTCKECMMFIVVI
jgi:hypothetical protein